MPEAGIQWDIMVRSLDDKYGTTKGATFTNAD